MFEYTVFNDMDETWSPDGPASPVWDPLASIPDIVQDTDETLMDLLITETIERATDYLEGFNLPRSGVSEPDLIKVRGMEIGDDRADVSNSARALALVLVVQSLWFGMSTSYKDTAISMNRWNLCEVISTVPTTPEGSISRAKVNGFDNLDYVDTPPLRIVVDVQKGSRDHSSSAVGKSQMLGSRTRSSRTNCRPLMEVANWLQDSMLNCCQSPEPKYMPWNMGGSSAPALWGEWRNLYMFVRCYKHGTYSRIWGSATNEMRNCVRDLDMGLKTQPVLANRLRMKQGYLHITYSDKVMVPILPLKNPLTGRTVAPAYRALGGSSLLQGVENRLVQSKRLCTSTGAKVEIESSSKIRDTIFGHQVAEWVAWDKSISRARNLAEFDGALTANSAVRRLLDRKANHTDCLKLMSDENFITMSGGVLELSKYDAQWIHGGGKGEAFTAADLSYSEDMYFREDVSCTHLLKVGGIQLTPLFRTQPVTERVTTSREGLWQVSQSMEDWADQMVSRLRAVNRTSGTPGYQQIQPIFFENREWVSDDTLIVDEVCRISSNLTSGSVLIATADKKLCRVASRTSGITIVQVHPVEVYKIVGPRCQVPGVSIDPRGILSPNHRSGRPVVGAPALVGDMIIDTGSMKAFLTRMDRVGPQNSLYVRKLLQTGFNEDGKRYSTTNLLKLRDSCEIRNLLVYFPNGTERRCVVKDDVSRGVGGTVSRLACSLPRFKRR